MTERKTLILATSLQEHPTAFAPGTPAGRKLAAFLDAFNSADREAITRFMTEEYNDAPGSQPAAERALWALNLQRDTGGLRLSYLGPQDELDIQAYAQAELTGEWFTLRVTAAEEEPHQVKSLTVRISQRPPDAGPHPALSDSEMTLRLMDMLGRLTRADMFSGTILITREGQTIFEFVCGQANQAYTVPNRMDTRFNVGSMCKSFTAVAIAQLAERGLLAYDAPLSTYLPDYPAEVAYKVTLHHLLTHTSGLGQYWNERFMATRPRLRKVADFIPLFVYDPLAFEPGTRYSYSNAGYILLGAVIEAVSGEDYYDYVREHIYKPAGMADTEAYEMDRVVPNIAIGYTHNGLDDQPEFGPRRNNLFMHVVKGGPAGGAFSTVGDLQRFSKALLGHQLLGEDATETVLSSKVRISTGVERQYGYGFMVSYVNGRRVVGHSGTFPGIGARLDMYLDHGYTVAILSNYDPYITQAIGNRLREWIAGY